MIINSLPCIRYIQLSGPYMYSQPRDPERVAQRFPSARVLVPRCVKTFLLCPSVPLNSYHRLGDVRRVSQIAWMLCIVCLSPHLLLRCRSFSCYSRPFVVKTLRRIVAFLGYAIRWVSTFRRPIGCDQCINIVVVDVVETAQ